ncbi:MAG: ABC transporter permease, partial [Aeromicrobium sp.]
MILYVLRRFINYAILTVIATVMTYMLASSLENPSARYYGKNPRPSEETVNKILNQLGVNPHTPLIERTWHWFTQIILHGNFGDSVDATTVQHQILVRSGVSLKLLIAGSLIGAVLGVALGVWGAVKQYKTSDQVVTYLSFLVLATPVFVIGVLLMIIATWLNNTTGHQLISFTGEYTPTVEGTWPVIWDRLGHLLLPTIALSLLGAAEYSRYQRNAMLDVLSA